MSGDEDDYLSDKFLLNAGSNQSAPKTYTQIRKEADRKAKLKNEQNKLKSRRQREVEAREEGLSKSLFERAKEEEDSGITSGNKALSMMMKMGFKPGQPLGRLDEPTPPTTPPQEHSTTPQPNEVLSSKQPATTDKGDNRQIVEPIPLNEWGGKKGIGLGKRARSPTSAERVATMAKLAKVTEEANHRDYRDRARQEYEERRAEGKLIPAQRTCMSLDEQAGKSFHVLWLNSNNPDTFPPGLLDVLTLHGLPRLAHDRQGEPIQVRLRRQMQEDALQPLDNSEGSPATKKDLETFSPEVIEEAIQFLRLQALDRLHLVLSYLHDRYAYCFWCGVQYEDEETMRKECPGLDEESHD